MIQPEHGSTSFVYYIGPGDHMLFPDYVDNNQLAVGLYCDYLDTYGEVFMIDDPFIIKALHTHKLTLVQARFLENPELTKRLDFGSVMDEQPTLVEFAPSVDSKATLFAAHQPPGTGQFH